jgi:PLD-like domain
MPKRRPNLRARTALATVGFLVATLFAVVLAPAKADAATAPTCHSFGALTGRRVWVNTPTYHQLATGIDLMICAAADYSTIDVKSWFLVDDDALVHSMVARLRFMQYYHHVHVNVLVGYDVRHPYADVQRTFWFAHVAECRYGCVDQHGLAKSHSKWITVSRLKWTGQTGVLSTSSNWSDRQFTLTQSAMVSVGDRSLYDQFVTRWSELNYCATHACHPVSPAVYRGTGAMRVMFFPVTSTDPIADELARAACTRGGSIRLSSLYLSRHAVISQLTAARARGCLVRVLLGVLPDTTTNRALAPHIGRIHDKFVLIYTPRLKVVIEGSANFTYAALSQDDEQMVRVGTSGVVAVYVSYFDHVWSSTPASPTVVPHGLHGDRAQPAIHPVTAADL